MAYKKKESPVMHMPGCLLWLFCFPVALIIDLCWDAKEEKKKWRAKQHEKAVKHWDDYWNF